MPKGVWESPWSMRVADHQGRAITVQVAFNPNTLAIVNPGLDGVREAGCLYDELLIGRPDDGTMKVFPIPEGDFSVNRQVMANRGFTTIQEMANANVTFGNSTG